MSIIDGKMTSQQEESESDFINGTVEKKGIGNVGSQK